MSSIPGINAIRGSIERNTSNKTPDMISILDQCPEMEDPDADKLAYMTKIRSKFIQHTHGMSSQEIADNTIFWNQPLQLIFDAVDDALATPRHRYVVHDEVCTPVDEMTLEEMRIVLAAFLKTRNKRAGNYPTPQQCLYGTENGQPDTESAWWPDDDEEL